jgi:CspA family cold shock protein
MLAHVGTRSAAGRRFRQSLMATGKLKLWRADRGYGFVTDDSGGPDQFVHASALQRYGLDPEQIKIGTRLSFQVDNTKPGRYAAVDLMLA